MKTQAAINLYNELSSTPVGGTEEQGPVECVTKFGVFMLTKGSSTYLPYSIRQPVINVKREDDAPEYWKMQERRNKESQTRFDEESEKFRQVASTLREWADAIEGIILPTEPK